MDWIIATAACFVEPHKHLLCESRRWICGIRSVAEVNELVIRNDTLQISITLMAENLMTISRWLEDESIIKVAVNGHRMYKTIKSICGVETAGIKCVELASKILQNPDVAPEDVEECIAEDGLQAVWDLENAVMPAVADMELGGTMIDEEVWEAALKIQEDIAREAKKKLDLFAAPYFDTLDDGSPDINYRSTPQVLRLLQYLRIQMPHIRRDGRETLVPLVNTNRNSLLRLAKLPVVQEIMKIRSATMLMNQFGPKVLELRDPHTRRLHPLIDQLGTVTGRFTSHPKSPFNILAVPKKGLYRQAFWGGEGTLTESHDYDGFELRIWAELSGDPVLREAFCRGVDVHSFLATRLFGKTVSKAENPHIRTIVKKINFGIMYGMTMETLFYELKAENPEISYEVAKDLNAGFCRLLKVGMSYLWDCGQAAVNDGRLRLASGRKRTWYVKDLVAHQRRRIEREGMNMTIQATGAEIIKRAMVDLRNYKKRTGYRSEFFSQIYDELNTFTAKGDSPTFSPVKTAIMVAAGEKHVRSVPMVVTSTVGERWGTI